MRLKNIRSRKGASMIVLITCIAFFIVLPLSLVGFEMGRYFLLITQVENVAGACALSGTGAIATIPSTASGGAGLAALYMSCMREAVYCLQLNSILGHPMSNAIGSAPYNISYNTLAPYAAPPTPPDGQAAISISLVNQDGSPHPSLTTSGAVKMAVTISYTTHPVFSTPGLILSLMPTETATASSTGGLPQLDVFLAFDLSGSMDDQTGVVYVNRYWDVVNHHVAYSTAMNLGPGTGPETIYNQTPGIGINGTQLNAIPPQNLSKCSSSFYFNQQLRCSAASEAGQMPGGVTMILGVPTPQPITYTNGPAGGTTQDPYATPGVPASGPNPTWYNPNGISFTDMVVVPSTAGVGVAYAAPAGWRTTAIVEVEQSRGNLISLANLQASQGGAPSLALLTAAVGDPADAGVGAALTAAVGNTPQQYWAMAAQAATPSFQALTAGQNFVSTMNLSTDARFGLSTFADTASSSSVNTIPATNYLISGAWGTGWYAASSYPAGGITPGGGTLPLPWVSLSAGTPGSYNQAFAALAPPDATYNPATTTTQAVPTGSTDMYDALNNAINDVIANGRPTARKAIVLFTDGIPTASIANNNDTALWALAATCRGPNIPIYTIGLATNGALVGPETTTLQGISSAGGNAPLGQFYATTSATGLNAAFQSIARGLVLLRAG